MRRPTVAAVAFVFLFAVSATPKDKPKSYQSGKLLDVSVQSVSRGTAIVGGMAASIPGRLYEFQIESGDLIYFADYSAGKLSYEPQWVVNDPIEFRLEENKMFLKRPDGKELEVRVIKRVRREPVPR